MRNTEARVRYDVMKNLHASVHRSLDVVEFVELDENPERRRERVRDITNDYAKNRQHYETKQMDGKEEEQYSIIQMVID